MLRCKECRIVLDNDARFCPKCGRDVASDAPGSKAGGDVETLLASANLHRMRSEWDAAISDATDALRIDPRNPDIASLLGDIYEQRDMLDEALVWYQMALELEPGSEPDRQRLDHVSELVAARREAERTGSFRAFQKHTRIWTIALVAIFVTVVSFAGITALFKGKPSGPARPKQTRVERPSGGGEPSRPMPLGPAAPNPSSESTDLAGTAAGGSAFRTPAEADIRSGLSAAQSITDAGVTIDDAIADPRAGVVTVTFSVPFKGFVSREQITRAAVAVARTTFGLRQDIRFVTARCVIQAGGAKPQIAFVGDAARQSIDALAENATDEQLAAVFTRPWWNPGIRE
jgi:hypothetical protein